MKNYDLKIWKMAMFYATQESIPTFTLENFKILEI
jgi:hypothetical protein